MELAVEILSGGTGSESRLSRMIRPVKDAKAGKAGGKDGKAAAGGGAGGAAGGGADDDKGKAVAPEVLPVESPVVKRKKDFLFSFKYDILSFPNKLITGDVSVSSWMLTTRRASCFLARCLKPP